MLLMSGRQACTSPVGGMVTQLGPGADMFRCQVPSHGIQWGHSRPMHWQRPQVLQGDCSEQHCC